MDEDEQYARWLQQQEILSISDEETRAAATSQFQIGNQSNFDDQAVAMALQEDYNQDLVKTDEVIASNVHSAHLDQSNVDDQVVAMTLQKDYNLDLVKTDEVIASNVHSAHLDQDGDIEQMNVNLANALQEAETSLVTQNDEQIAQEIAATETMATDSAQQQMNDELVAQELYTRDKDYGQQLANDEALAKELLEQFKQESCQNSAANLSALLPQRQSYQSSTDQMVSDEVFAKALLEQFKAESRNSAPDLPSGLEQLFGVPPSNARQRPHHRRGMVRSQMVRSQYGAAQHQLDQADGSGNDYEDLLQLGEDLGEAREQGLHDDQVNVLPTQTYRPPSQALDPRASGPSGTGPGQQGAQNTAAVLEEDKQCKVCFEDYASGDTLRMLPCCHKYHRDCIDEWIKKKAICPICKLEIKEEIRRAVSM